jgi:hypothetical protein
MIGILSWVDRLVVWTGAAFLSLLSEKSVPQERREAFEEELLVLYLFPCPIITIICLGIVF